MRDAELEAIGVWQVPDRVPWTAAWHRQLVRPNRYKAEGGARAELLHGPRFYRGADLGAWLREQHVRWNQLHPQQQHALTALHMDPVRSQAWAGAGVPAARRGRAERLQEIVTAARRHVDDVGPLSDEAGRIKVAAGYVPEVDGRPVQLRKRLYAVRDRFNGYTQELQALFVGLGPGRNPMVDCRP
ncbi:hypothetical protein [Streptomyces sp. TLI_146]|uniref:hypothetical protein n=1 Tax=Streptomyces sp. TLI_146 TaxID=1938858 RepID=UPI000C71272C|nr:hypothetical protein [Streptomyces sp. TLI_146]